MKTWIKNSIGVLAVVVVAALTGVAVRTFHEPGQLDVINAQAMDMSAMRPPAGAALVSVDSVKRGAVSDTVTYTGSVLAYNEQDISARITGLVVALPVYPGDTVHSGQLVAQLDSAEVGAQTQQAERNAQAAQIGAEVAHLTHHVHHKAALEQANAQVTEAQQGVSDAQAEAAADDAAISEAQAGVLSAQASADYWKTEIAREKQLADAGAVSKQEYQNEVAQSQTAFAALIQARAKVTEALATDKAAHVKIETARSQVSAADAGVRMAQADIIVAAGQSSQAEASALAAQSGVDQASIVQGYTRITSPSNGVVTQRLIAPGTLAQPGTVLLKIAEIDRVRVQANVSVGDVSGLGVGSPVQIVLQDGGSTIDSHVTSIFPSANPETRTAVVEAMIDNPGHKILPGSFVAMKISKQGDGDQLMVPVSSIVSVDGQSYVWVATGASPARGVTYECVICHIHYTAAQAAKFHYRDPMEGGKLVPIKGTGTAPTTAAVTAHEAPVQVLGSDGVWAQVTSDTLTSADKVVTQGIAGLSEGVRIASTAWGPDGPKSLPTAAMADTGLSVYRCEKCGMSFSAADAKKYNYIDPMDGGKLVPAGPSS
jgi:multidrug efflux pump subunit AcrA (membrane-fusion protein)